LTIEGLQRVEAMLDFARDLPRLARLTLDQGYGPETVWELAMTLAAQAAQCQSVFQRRLHAKQRPLMARQFWWG
jgi:hypothetical protein